MSQDVFDHTTPRMGRVRLLTTVMIGVTALFCVYWSVHIISWLVPFIFAGGMQASGWVEDGVIISFGQKAALFIIWAVTIMIAWFSFAAAIRMLLALRAGAFFATETCKRIQTFGLSLTAVMIADTVLTTLFNPIMTWGNAPVVMIDGERAAGSIGNVGLAYTFDSADIAITLCGLGFFVIGWVLAEGALIAEENKAFV